MAGRLRCSGLGVSAVGVVVGGPCLECGNADCDAGWDEKLDAYEQSSGGCFGCTSEQGADDHSGDRGLDGMGGDTGHRRLFGLIRTL